MHPPRRVDTGIVFAVPPSIPPVVGPVDCSSLSPAGSEPLYAGFAGTPIHAQSRGHLCLFDLLDVALGRAGRFVVGADSGFNQSRLRPRPGDVARQRTSLATGRQYIIRELR